MIVPTVPVLHSNGSGFENLMTGYREVHDVLSTALKALQEHSPHERDYYIVDGLWQKARAEHITRLDCLRNIQREIRDIVWNLQKQQDLRGR